MLELLHDPDPARAHRAMEAMTRMIKIDIAEVECAADAGRKTFPAPVQRSQRNQQNQRNQGFGGLVGSFKKGEYSF